MWAQPTRAHLGPQAHPGGLCSPRSPPSGTSLAHRVSSGPEKSPKHFTVFGLHLVPIFWEVKNKETATHSGHYVNRLVRKNDIKLL